MGKDENGSLDMKEFKEGSKRDETIVLALSLYDDPRLISSSSLCCYAFIVALVALWIGDRVYAMRMNGEGWSALRGREDALLVRIPPYCWINCVKFKRGPHSKLCPLQKHRNAYHISQNTIYKTYLYILVNQFIKTPHYISALITNPKSQSRAAKSGSIKIQPCSMLSQRLTPLFKTNTNRADKIPFRSSCPAVIQTIPNSRAAQDG